LLLLLIKHWAKNSSQFAGHVTDHKNSQGILKNETPTGVGIPVFRLCHTSFFYFSPHDTQQVPVGYPPSITKKTKSEFCSGVVVCIE
jgi:hypothetical protein